VHLTLPEKSLLRESRILFRQKHFRFLVKSKNYQFANNNKWRVCHLFSTSKKDRRDFFTLFIFYFLPDIYKSVNVKVSSKGALTSKNAIERRSYFVKGPLNYFN